MKKLLAILITLSLVLCAMPALAELGSADVAMNGNQYHISLESVEIKDGRLYVALNGMAQTMAFGPEGIQLAADIVPVYGEERLYASDKDILFGVDVTYRFDRDTLPDSILLIPTQDAENPITLWENSDEEPAILDELVGQWHGTGTPVGGDEAIDLTAEVRADGSGRYAFEQSGYHESYDFTLESSDSTFTVNIPADNQLGITACEGTWTLKDGKLHLDIITTFANGRHFSYTAECEKVDETTAVESRNSSYSVGDIISFGHYEQDNDESNGPEPIEWIVLDAQDGRVLVLSKVALDWQAYDVVLRSSTYWSICSLREWLNADFLETAFTSEEQAAILTASVNNSDTQGYSGFNTTGGEDTEDKLFALSWQQVTQYFESPSERVCIPSTYAASQNNKAQAGDGCRWWLRSPGQAQLLGALISEDGDIFQATSLDMWNFVRPAFWMETGSIGGSVDTDTESTASEPDKGKDSISAASEPDKKADNVSAGDIITFGRYEQDNNASNGAEDIEWIVLETDGETATLISRYGLDAQPFNIENVDVTWENCTLRQWLNNDFYSTAFSGAEQGLIVETTISAGRGAERDTDSGSLTRDNVYLLNIDDAKHYFSPVSNMICFPTEYAIGKGLELRKEGWCEWWGFKLDNDGYTAAICWDTCFLSGLGSLIPTESNVAVRPLIHLRLTDQTIVDHVQIVAATMQPVTEPTPMPVASRNDAMDGTVSVGKIITFGHYEQDNDESNGAEPIEWIVLDTDGKTARLISRYGLDCRPYHTEPVAVTWESSALRQWLNNDFISAAFTDNELKQILTTTVTADISTRYNVNQGEDTKDRIFLLSTREGKEFFTSDQDRMCYPTQYAIAQGVDPDTDTGTCRWWLRTASALGYTEIIPEDGWIRGGFDVSRGAAVRPVIVLPLAVFDPEGTPDGNTAVMPLSDIIYDLNRLFMQVKKSASESGEYNDMGSLVIAIYTSESDAEPEILTSDSDKLYGFPVEYLAEGYETADRVAFIFPYYNKVGSYDKGGAAYSTMTCYTVVDLRSGGITSRITAITTEPPLTITVPTNNGFEAKGYGPFRPEAALNMLAAQEAENYNKSTPMPAQSNTPTPASIADTDAILTALDSPIYHTTYDALLSGEIIQNGSRGDTASGVQQTLVAFGQNISVDGSVGPKTLAALNEVQTAFGLPMTQTLDANGYAQLLPRLLVSTNPTRAEELLSETMEPGEYQYMVGCANVAKGLYYSAQLAFENSDWSNAQSRAAMCAQAWPKTGQLYKNPDVSGSSTELTVQFNTTPDTAMHVKIYTTGGVLARTMFIGGTGHATTRLPAGTYMIKAGVGKTWYGEEESFGKRAGSYEIMTFENGVQLVELKRNYSSTITINVLEQDATGQGVGSDYESWEDF